MNKTVSPKAKKGFKAKTNAAEPEVAQSISAPAQGPIVLGTREKKVEVPKLPVLSATKNDTLKCVVVVEGALTYFGREQVSNRGIWDWRKIYSQAQVKKLFEKAEAINADASLDESTKVKKIDEAYKSLASPCNNGVKFTHKVEGALPPPAPVASDGPIA
jgi:hypothetical protein